jgi:hypothetical protein
MICPHPHRQRGDPVNELIDRWLLHHHPALQYLLPQDAEMHLGQPIADAPMNPEPERQVLTRPRAIHQELVRPVDRVFVAVARDVPHAHLVALADLLAADLRIRQRGSPHVHDR